MVALCLLPRRLNSFFQLSSTRLVMRTTHTHEFTNKLPSTSTTSSPSVLALPPSFHFLSSPLRKNESNEKMFARIHHNPLSAHYPSSVPTPLVFHFLPFTYHSMKHQDCLHFRFHFTVRIAFSTPSNDHEFGRTAETNKQTNKQQQIRQQQQTKRIKREGERERECV